MNNLTFDTKIIYQREIDEKGEGETRARENERRIVQSIRTHTHTHTHT